MRAPSKCPSKIIHLIFWSPFPHASIAILRYLPPTKAHWRLSIDLLKPVSPCFHRHFSILAPNKSPLKIIHWSSGTHSPFIRASNNPIKLNLFPHTTISKRFPPQITPSGLVFWQGRVKARCVLTLHNVAQRWQPLRVGLSKTAANRDASPNAPAQTQQTPFSSYKSLTFKRSNRKKKQRIPTSAAFHHERKPFLSWGETLFITRTNLCHHDEKHKQSIFQKQQPNSTDKKPHPLHNEIANYADKNEHQ